MRRWIEDTVICLSFFFLAFSLITAKHAHDLQEEVKEYRESTIKEIQELTSRIDEYQKEQAVIVDGCLRGTWDRQREDR